jgi:hypothetical protein
MEKGLLGFSDILISVFRNFRAQAADPTLPSHLPWDGSPFKLPPHVPIFARKAPAFRSSSVIIENAGSLSRRYSLLFGRTEV